MPNLSKISVPSYEFSFQGFKKHLETAGPPRDTRFHISATRCPENDYRNEFYYDSKFSGDQRLDYIKDHNSTYNDIATPWYNPWPKPQTQEVDKHGLKVFNGYGDNA